MPLNNVKDANSILKPHHSFWSGPIFIIHLVLTVVLIFVILTGDQRWLVAFGSVWLVGSSAEHLFICFLTGIWISFPRCQFNISAPFETESFDFSLWLVRVLHACQSWVFYPAYAKILVQGTLLSYHHDSWWRTEVFGFSIKVSFFFSRLLLLFLVMGVKFRASCMLDKWSTIKSAAS